MFTLDLRNSTDASGRFSIFIEVKVLKFMYTCMKRKYIIHTHTHTHTHRYIYIYIYIYIYTYTYTYIYIYTLNT